MPHFAIPVTAPRPNNNRKSRGEQMAEMAYCVKCKAKKELKDGQKVTMKNGRPALNGKCSDCETGMYKILPVKK